MYFGHSLSWGEWVVSVIATAWGTWDFLKKPNDDEKRLRYGVWFEEIAITFWIATIRSDVLLFAYISPLARASIHLSIRDRFLLFTSSCIAIAFYGWWVPGSHIFIPLLVLLFVGTYSSMIGSLVNERQRAQRLIGLSEFEREQSVREHERIRISRQLHDTMGQYWTAVIRTIDVAEAVDMPKKQAFIQKAREAAELGLKEMRTIVRNSNDGKQSPEQWIDFALKSLERLKELTNINIEVNVPDSDWELFYQRVEISELIARTLIESLSNAIRHGKATMIWIDISEHHHEINLSIRDNGVGLIIDVQYGNGMGFQSLQEMTKEVGGTFQIESERNHGTKIMLQIPFEGGYTK
jgi:signal transduction histidine kinase